MKLTSTLRACTLALVALLQLANEEPPASNETTNNTSFGQPTASQADIERLAEKIEEQGRRVHDLQQSLSTFTRLLFTPTHPQTSETLIRRDEPHFRGIYTINREGTDLKFLIAAPGMLTSGTPQCSHNGQAIAFDSLPGVDMVVQSRIWTYGLSGPFKGMIRFLCAGNTPSWSPDDTRIAYMLNSGNPDAKEPGLWIMDADGTNHKRLGEGWYSRWSPDGQEICVQSNGDNSTCLKIYHLTTGEERTILGGELPVMFGGANWSPDGKQLITVIQRDNEQQLITIDSTGNPESIQIVYRLNSENKKLIGPAEMSPDKKEILFGIQDLDQPDSNDRMWMNSYIYVVAADGKSELRLLESEKKGKINRGGTWSADGKKIFFSSER